MRHLTLERSLTDRAYDAILDAICGGELPAGERINQDALAQRLNVSRQPIVQALALLKVQGFVRDTGRRGVVIAPLNGDAISHLYELRSALDGAACRSAAKRGGADARAWGPALIAEGRNAVASGSVKRMIEADMRFHRLLYELSGNPMIAETAALHWHHVRRLMGGYLQHYRVRESVWDEHEAILEAVMRGDGALAESWRAAMPKARPPISRSWPPRIAPHRRHRQGRASRRREGSADETHRRADRHLRD